MHHPVPPAKQRRGRALAAALALLLAVPVAQAGEPLEVSDEEAQALIDAIRGRGLSREQHDLLAGLAAPAGDATGEDRLYVGWALVFADRPDLGLPLVRRGLAELELGASDALRTLLFAETAGQDGLVRATLELLRRQGPEGALRLERSTRSPMPFATAQRRARGALKGLEVGELEVPFPAGGARRVVWSVRPPAPTGPSVIWLPDGGTAEGLPRTCQDDQRLREAAALARDGHAVYLPGLRGCDGSDGSYFGAEDAAKDLTALVGIVRRSEPGRELVLLGLEGGALLALRVADAVPVDRVVAWQPDDPGDPEHLPPDVVAARDVLTAPSKPVYVARPYPALAAVLGVEAPPDWLPLPRRQRAARAREVMAASAAPSPAR